jgi:hypothetical protein
MPSERQRTHAARGLQLPINQAEFQDHLAKCLALVKAKDHSHGCVLTLKEKKDAINCLEVQIVGCCAVLRWQ